MIRKIVGKFVKNFRKNVQKIEEKIDCVSGNTPIIECDLTGITLNYNTYAKSFGIMNMSNDGDWIKEKDFDLMFNKVEVYFQHIIEDQENQYEKLLAKQEKEVIFLKKIIVILGLGLAFNIVALASSFS